MGVAQLLLCAQVQGKQRASQSIQKRALSSWVTLRSIVIISSEINRSYRVSAWFRPACSAVRSVSFSAASMPSPEVVNVMVFVCIDLFLL